MKSRYLIFVAMGIELVGIIIGCLLIGQKLDESFSTKGLFLVTLPMLGLAGWITQVVVLSKKLENQADNNGDNPK